MFELVVELLQELVDDRGAFAALLGFQEGDECLRGGIGVAERHVGLHAGVEGVAEQFLFARESSGEGFEILEQSDRALGVVLLAPRDVGGEEERAHEHRTVHGAFVVVFGRVDAGADAGGDVIDHLRDLADDLLTLGGGELFLIEPLAEGDHLVEAGGRVTLVVGGDFAEVIDGLRVFSV